MAVGHANLLRLLPAFAACRAERHYTLRGHSLFDHALVDKLDGATQDGTRAESEWHYCLEQLGIATEQVCQAPPSLSAASSFVNGHPGAPLRHECLHPDISLSSTFLSPAIMNVYQCVPRLTMSSRTSGHCQTILPQEHKWQHLILRICRMHICSSSGRFGAVIMCFFML